MSQYEDDYDVAREGILEGITEAIEQEAKRCAYCDRNQGAFNGTLKEVICIPCLEKLSASNAAFDARCAEDTEFEDWAAGGGSE